MSGFTESLKKGIHETTDIVYDGRGVGKYATPLCNYSLLNSLFQNVWNLSRNLLVLSF